MPEQRSGTRWPSLLNGHVLMDDGRSVHCSIRDFSSAGARIQVSAAVKLPASFNLLFPLTQATFRVHVRWRANEETGVEFEPFDRPEILPPTDPVQAMLLEKLLKVEAEKSEIQGRLAGLLSSLEHVG